MRTLRLPVPLLLVAALAATAAAARGASPGDAVYRKLCRSIKAQHVQPLFRAPVGPIRLGGNADCAFAARGGDPDVAGIKVFLRIDDGDRTLWSHRGDRSYGTFRRLAVNAKWGYLGGRLPSVVDVRRGAFTCTVIPIGTTGLAIPPGAPRTAARAFARRLLAVCGDVFAAH